MLIDPKERLLYLIDEAWLVLFNKIISGKQSINKEASLQLQLSTFILKNSFVSQIINTILNISLKEWQVQFL
jgi:hypothetical protein